MKTWAIVLIVLVAMMLATWAVVWNAHPASRICPGSDIFTPASQPCGNA